MTHKQNDPLISIPASLPDLTALQTVFARAVDFFALTDCDGRLLYTNHPAAAPAQGARWSETLFDLMLPSVRDTVRRMHQRVAATGQPARVEVPTRGAEGGVVWMLLSSSPIRTSDAITALLHVGTDVTERRKEEERLRRVESLTVDTEGMAHYGVWEWDITQPHATWTLGLYTIYGLDPKTYVPSYEEYLKRVHPEDRQRVMDATNAVFHQHQPYSHDERIFHSDGSIRYLHTWAVPVLSDEGKLLRLMGVCLDITDRKLAEIALAERAAELDVLNRELEKRVSQRTQELFAAKTAAEEANASKSLFLAAMSHEVRTPMNGVLGMLELLTEENLTAEQRRMLGTVRESSEALLGILDDILDFSKIEAGRLELESIPVNPRRIVETVADTLAANAQRKHLRLHCDVDPALPQWLRGDEVRLRQILLNLGSNAIKFTQTTPARQGEVWLCADCSKIDTGSVELRLSVRDNGIGMEESVQRQLFQPFTQADASTTRRFGGTGLGLSICKRLIDLMGGEIRVESQPGAGSTFTVYLRLPVASKSLREPATGNLSAVVADLANRLDERQCILVAEDNLINQEILQRQLERLGYTCVIVENGRQALEQWQRRSFGLLLTDCHMPEMDGFELTRAIRLAETVNSRRLPIVAITANALRGEADRCLQAGMNDYLAKPVQLASLRQVLERWLGAPGQPLSAAAEQASIEEAGHRVWAPERLAETLGPEPQIQAELLDCYRVASPEQLAAIVNAARRCDREATGFAAHRLKSAALAIASDDVGRLCEHIEQASRQDDWQRIEPLVERLQLRHQDLLKQLQDYLAGLPKG